MTTVVDDLREVVDHDTDLPPIPDNSAEGQEELDTTGEHPPTANVPAVEEEEEDDADQEIVDHDTNLPPIPDSSAKGPEESDNTGEHPPTANVPAVEEEEQDDADPEIVGLLVPPFQHNVGPVPYDVEDPADMLYNSMLMVWDELSVEQRLRVLRVSEAIHSGDAADVLKFNELPSGHGAKIGTFVANANVRSIMWYGKDTRLTLM